MTRWSTFRLTTCSPSPSRIFTKIRTGEHVAEHMAAFNVGTVISTSVHEAYPGHYVQFLWMPQFPSKIRKVLGANTNIEGWAHYTEQMMLDQGYGQPGAGAKDE